MGCCGGKVGPKIVQRASSPRPTRTKQPRAIPPANSRRLVRNDNAQLRTPTVLKAKARADGTKSCPLCGAMVKTVLAGTGSRKRFICSSCGNQFSK